MRREENESGGCQEATLKELQEVLASTGCVVHVTTISRLLYMFGLRGSVARQKLHLKSPKCMWENVLWSDGTKVERCRTRLLIT